MTNRYVMTFKAYQDAKFDKLLPNTPTDGFKVMINPETFERTVSVKSEKDKTSRSGNSPGHDAGLNAEKYSFDLYFDGTGAAGEKLTGKELNKKFNTFLDVVYATRSSPDKKKKANCVEFNYCGEVFHCRMESMTIRYLLFETSGEPIRIKTSCTFTSVEDPKEDDPEAKKKKDSKKKKAVTKKTPNCECVNPAPSYKETKASAEENDSVSMLTCGYPRSQMSSELNYTPADLNYTPASGYPQ